MGLIKDFQEFLIYMDKRADEKRQAKLKAIEDARIAKKKQQDEDGITALEKKKSDRIAYLKERRMKLAVEVEAKIAELAEFSRWARTDAKGKETRTDSEIARLSTMKASIASGNKELELIPVELAELEDS